MPFINFTELYNAGGSFARQVVTVSGNTTTIYGGYAPRAEISHETEAMGGWLIRKLVVVDDGTTQDITCGWASGAWSDRASLQYTFFKP